MTARCLRWIKTRPLSLHCIVLKASERLCYYFCLGFFFSISGVRQDWLLNLFTQTEDGAQMQTAPDLYMDSRCIFFRYMNSFFVWFCSVWSQSDLWCNRIVTYFRLLRRLHGGHTDPHSCRNHRFCCHYWCTLYNYKLFKTAPLQLQTKHLLIPLKTYSNHFCLGIQNNDPKNRKSSALFCWTV